MAKLLFQYISHQYSAMTNALGRRRLQAASLGRKFSPGKSADDPANRICRDNRPDLDGKTKYEIDQHVTVNLTAF